MSNVAKGKLRRPRFYNCDLCGEWHLADFDGDCRDDAKRFTVGQLDILFPDDNGDGWPDWVEVDDPSDTVI